jgi:hypothetical protein
LPVASAVVASAAGGDSWVIVASSADVDLRTVRRAASTVVVGFTAAVASTVAAEASTVAAEASTAAAEASTAAAVAAASMAEVAVADTGNLSGL